jgi:hypothetical protein
MSLLILVVFMSWISEREKKDRKEMVWWRERRRRED